MRWVVIFVALWLIPSVQAAVGDGSEEDPHLADPAGDVSYSTHHTGSPRPHLDIRAAWVETVPANDTFAIVLKTSNASQLDSLSPERRVVCMMTVGVYDDNETQGWLDFQYRVEPSTRPHVAPGLQEGIRYTEGGDNASSAPIPHGFAMEADEPGYTRYWIDRLAMQRLGSELRGFGMFCSESQHPSMGTALVVGRDDANSTAFFSLSDRDQSAGGAERGFWRLNSSLPGRPPADNDTPAVGLLASAAVLLAAAVVSHRRL